MSVTLSRPRKFKGPKREYLKVDFSGKVQNVMIDEEITSNWEDIIDLTVGEVSYSQRAATQADVDEKKAASVGEVIHENWNRLEVIDFTTMSRDEKLAAHKGKMSQIATSYKLVSAKELDQATA